MTDQTLACRGKAYWHISCLATPSVLSLLNRFFSEANAYLFSVPLSDTDPKTALTHRRFLKKNSHRFRLSDPTPTVLLNKHRLISFKTPTSSIFSSPLWKVRSPVCPKNPCCFVSPHHSSILSFGTVLSLFRYLCLWFSIATHEEWSPTDKSL